MQNIHRIREHIVNNYKNIDADLVAPLTYIKTLAKPKGDILLIYKKVTPSPSVKFEIAGSPNGTHNIDTSALDVTGTPLEDNCEISMISDWSVVKKFTKTNPWTDDEEQYSGVAVDLATDIINEINIEKTSECNNGSIYVICEGANDDKQFLLNTQYDKDWHFRGIGKFTGLIPLKQIDIPTLMNNHLKFLRNCNEARTKIETYFNIKANQTIKCSWDTMSLTPSIKCSKNAAVVLSQSIPIGDFNSSIEEYWRQLEIMDGIKQDIEKYKKSQNNADLVYQRCASPLDLHKIEEHIMSILSNIPPYDTPKKTDSFDIASVVARMENDRHVDVTDQLWSVLRFCSSYKDLLHSLLYIFQCAAQSIVVNMPNNKNRLASLIRETSEKRHIPRLSGTEPLEILLEIGLLKISKDYEYILTESRICTSDGFQTFIRETQEKAPVSDRKTLHHAVEANRKTLLNRNDQLDILNLNMNGYGYIHFDKGVVDAYLTKFAQIHLLLEHIIFMQVSLNLDHTVLGSIMNNLSKNGIEFSRLKTMKYDKREFSIAANKILPKIENHTPEMIRISMKTKNRFKYVKNIHIYSVDPICPLNVFPYMQNSEEIVSKDILYCGLHYIKIGSSKN